VGSAGLHDGFGVLMVTRFPSGLVVNDVLTPGMSTSITVHFEPSVGILARKVDKLGQDIRSFREPLMRSVREVVIPSIQMNFAKSGRPRWADLSEDTWKQKRAGSKILVETGNLRNGMKALSLWHIDKEKALIADLPQSIWYGKVHQSGYGGAEMFHDPVTGSTVNVGGSGAPARPFIMLQSEDVEKIDVIFNEWLEMRIQRAGF